MLGGLGEGVLVPGRTAAPRTSPPAGRTCRSPWPPWPLARCQSPNRHGEELEALVDVIPHTTDATSWTSASDRGSGHRHVGAGAITPAGEVEVDADGLKRSASRRACWVPDMQADQRPPQAQDPAPQPGRRPLPPRSECAHAGRLGRSPWSALPPRPAGPHDPGNGFGGRRAPRLASAAEGEAVLAHGGRTRSVPVHHFVDHVVGQVRRAVAGQLPDPVRRKAGQTLGEDLPVRAGMISTAASGLERTVHGDHTWRAGATRLVRQARYGLFVDHDRPGSSRRQAQSTARRRAGDRARDDDRPSDARESRHRGPSKRSGGRRRRSPPAPRTRRRSWPPPASRPSPRCPGPCSLPLGQGLHLGWSTATMIFDQRGVAVDGGGWR